MENHVDLKNARRPDQRSVMEQIIKDGKCPFCEENLRMYHTQKIHTENEFWILTDNQYPYTGTKVHLLAISKIHAEALSELPVGTGEALLDLMKWAEHEFCSSGGAFAMRFGKTEFSGATVKHLHAQFILPSVEHLNRGNNITFYIGTPKKQ